LLTASREIEAIDQLASRITSLNIAPIRNSISHEMREETKSMLLTQALARWRVQAAEITQLSATHSNPKALRIIGRLCRTHLLLRGPWLRVCR
jgi:hypothetical protein